MKLKYGIAPLAIAALFAAGCETTGVYGGGSSETTTTTTTSSTSSAEAARLAELERQNAALRSQNSQLQSDVASARTASTTTTTRSIGGNADLPPAKPGECYARILIPATYSTSTEKVVDVEASERVEIIPARYEWVEERVQVQAPSERIEVIPAKYETVTETVVVEPAKTELVTVPAKYSTKTERVLVREGYTTWKQGKGPIGGSLDGGTIKDTRGSATGEIMCLVEVPPEYRTVTRKVLVEPARTIEKPIPAVTKTVTKRVVAQPATTRAIPIPAKYDTVKVRKMVSPPQEKRIPIPATYKTVTKQRKVTDESLVWREILCETNTTPDVIRRVQTALNKNGFNLNVDGQLGPSTMRAIDAYQRRNNLGTGGLTMATVKKLGVM
ncbi:MAG: peptidoglycan-binding domain-containing protein [bacterium]